MCDFRAKCISFLSIFITVMSVFVACLVSSIHKVNEGKVGIYLKYGALMDDTTGPGMHTMAPFVTEVRISTGWFFFVVRGCHEENSGIS